jgi:transposase-like protein
MKTGKTNRSWRMDETYIKVKGEWGYLYRAVDSHGDTLDFMLSEPIIVANPAKINKRLILAKPA